VPDWAVTLIAGVINPKWILVIIFIIVTIIVALTAKFYIGSLQKISKFLSWPPIALVIVIFCLVQGFALWIFGVSIFGLNLL
jgi:Ca2+/H+ antiporter